MTDTRRRHPLLGPWWISAHVIIVLIAIVFPQLSAWQFGRLNEERALAELQDERISGQPQELAAVLGAHDMQVTAGSIADDRAQQLQFTPVTVTGTWVADEQVAQRNRAFNGSGGFDLLTPLAVTDGPLAGMAVLVRRGWVPPVSAASADPTPDTPVGGEVTVTGFLETPVDQPDFGPTDAATGTLDTVFHADVQRLDQQVSLPLVDMIVWLTDQSPDDGQLPITQPPPARDTSQNLSYALQWAAFTIIVVGGYAIVVRKRLADHRAGIDSDTDPLLRDRVDAA